MPLPIHSRGRIYCKQNAVRAVRYNTDGQYCMTCGADKSIKLWNPVKKLFLKSYMGHGFEVTDARASFDNSQLCSGGQDKLVILWDVASGQSLRRLRFHAGKINVVQFNDEASLVFSASMDGKVGIWDVKSKNPVPQQVLDEARDNVTGLCVHKWQIVTVSMDSHIRRYDIRKGLMIEDYVGHPLTWLNVTRDGQCSLCSVSEKPLLLFDNGTGELLNEYSGLSKSSYHIESGILASDTHIVSGSDDGNVVIWDLITAKQVEKLEHDNARVIPSIAAHPKENCLLAASQDFIYIWSDKTESDE